MAFDFVAEEKYEFRKSVSKKKNRGTNRRQKKLMEIRKKSNEEVEKGQEERDKS